MGGQLPILRKAYITNMSLLVGIEPFQKFAVVGGEKAFWGSTLVSMCQKQNCCCFPQNALTLRSLRSSICQRG